MKEFEKWWLSNKPPLDWNTRFDIHPMEYGEASWKAALEWALDIGQGYDVQQERIIKQELEKD